MIFGERMNPLVLVITCLINGGLLGFHNLLIRSPLILSSNRTSKLENCLVNFKVHGDWGDWLRRFLGNEMFFF